MERATIKKQQSVLAMMAIAIIGLLSCSENKKFGITGSYVNHAKSEFSIAHDTLIIENDREDSYFIHRHTGIRLIDGHGNTGEEILEKEDWRGDYDTKSGVMTERSKGRRIVFGQHSLTLESAVYRRIP